MRLTTVDLVCSDELLGVIDRLKAMRGPGESYSDVIIRIARGCSVCRTLGARPRKDE
jgi:hypothetical protein